MHSDEKGALSEIKVASRLMERGYTVSKPLFGSARYDLLADDGRIHRIQCKHGRYRDGVVIFNTASYCAFTKVDKVYTSDEIDMFGIYCSSLDEVFLVPVEETPKSKGILRVDPPKNGQSKGIRFASEFKL